MALRPLLGCLAFVVLAAACGKDKKEQAAAADLEARCALLGKACGDKDKHMERITEECKGAAKPPSEKGCAAQAMSLYDCWEKDVCGGKDKVWSLDDLKKLADRNTKCAAQKKALEDCTAK